MQRRALSTIYVAIGIVAVIFVAACVLSWATSRVANDPLGIGQLWFAALSFIASGLGLVALVWTFYEQRKLTQNESCAYLEVVRAEILHSAMFGLTYRLHIRNTGNTPARGIGAKIDLTREYEGHHGDGLKPYRVTMGLALDELAAHAAGYVQATDTELLDIAGLNELMGSAYERFGVLVEEEGSDRRPAALRFVGSLTYFDVYDRKHVISIQQYTHSIGGGVFGTGTEALRSVLD